MSDLDTDIAPFAADAAENPHDAEARLTSDFVDRVIERVDAGEIDAARALVAPLHPADIADLFELAPSDDRQPLATALADLIDGDVLAEMNDWVREQIMEELSAHQVAEIASELDTDDAVAIIADMEEEDQRAVLRAMEPDDRAAIEEALSYPDESAGRLMQRDLIAVPEHWTVGDVRDYLHGNEDLTTDFWEVFVVDIGHKPIGTCKLSWLMRAPDVTPVSDVMMREQTLIPADMDQEEVALRFQKYALISAAVIDTSGRLVGMITVDDVVHIIQEEAGEDALLLSGAGDGDINEPILFTVRTRLLWLVVNLGTAIIASSVVGLFQGEIAKFALLAVLMPIVSGMGGNAGTQTLAVIVRAIATDQLVSSNTVRAIGREFRIAAANGSALGLLIGGGTYLIYRNPMLALTIGLAMLINNLIAGLAGVLIPIGLDKARVDPAVSSAVFVTMCTDCMGFFSFLGLATLFHLQAG
ncbi:magnesium transporter [Sphingomonas nostoxanthinifaciens]|uniref:magnesium transporter n=1 Tax=Sphingomonas nostoxanthinifaciens TaxID=2872652 RepID=UPI001CC21A07|nr:magnesium transporter [Sphingomonas nostoxanthinifaciens]UAK24663.1 magnesium transporter [Sphingomonas nostoxanthinifaciens]